MNKFTIRKLSDLSFVGTALGYNRASALYEYCTSYNLDITLYCAVPYGW